MRILFRILLYNIVMCKHYFKFCFKSSTNHVKSSLAHELLQTMSSCKYINRYRIRYTMLVTTSKFTEVSVNIDITLTSQSNLLIF
jgi:hypothetical protein